MLSKIFHMFDDELQLLQNLDGLGKYWQASNMTYDLYCIFLLCTSKSIQSWNMSTYLNKYNLDWFKSSILQNVLLYTRQSLSKRIEIFPKKGDRCFPSTFSLWSHELGLSIWGITLELAGNFRHIVLRFSKRVPKI